MSNPIYAWALSIITSHSPPTQAQFVKDAKESVDVAQERRESIAKDVIDVVYGDPGPAMFSGPHARARTAVLVLAIMAHESGFRRDVDYGLGPLSKGDAGTSYCLMQLRVGAGRTGAWNTRQHRFAFPSDPPEDVVQGWTGAEVLADRKKCITAGLRVIRESFRATAGMPVSERLRVYASGSPTSGSHASQQRMGTAIRWYKEHPAPMTDDEAMALLFPVPPVEEPKADAGALLFPVTPVEEPKADAGVDALLAPPIILPRCGTLARYTWTAPLRVTTTL